MVSRTSHVHFIMLMINNYLSVLLGASGEDIKRFYGGDLPFLCHKRVV